MSMNAYYFFISLMFICFSCTNYDCDSRKEGHRAIWSFAKKIHKKRQWNIISIGGSYGTPYLKQIHVSFVCDELVDLERARRLLVEGIEDFLEDINSNKRLRPYLPINPLTYRHLCFGIRFRHLECIPPLPYIAYALLSDGKIADFSFDDPIKNELVSVQTEPFENILRIVAKDTQLKIFPLDEKSTQVADIENQENKIFKDEKPTSN